MSRRKLNRRQFIQGTGGGLAAVALESFGVNSGDATGDIRPNRAVPQLTEDYQVLQRDSSDQAACRVILPDRMKKATIFLVKVSHENGTILRNQEMHAQDSSGGEKSLLLDNLPVGGPYVIDIVAKAALADPTDKLLFRN